MFSNSSIILLLPIHLLSLFQGQASCDVVCRFVQAEQWPSRGHIIARDCTYAVFPDIFMSFSYSYCRKETEKGIRVKGKKESGKGREKKEERKEGRDGGRERGKEGGKKGKGREKGRIKLRKINLIL